jgi:DNA repair exonuclease SbcCD ATPase subunit
VLLDLKEQQNKFLDLKNEILKEREMFDLATVILRDSGIKSRIIKQYVPVINKLVNKYLASMDFFVKFELNESFEEKILSRHRDDFTYDSFSEGEKMRIDLALLFTWRSIARMKNSASTNLLILDEVFDASLDTNGCDEFLKLINNLEETNVFVISHKGDVLHDKFSNVIRFTKHKNFSRIV